MSEQKTPDTDLKRLILDTTRRLLIREGYANLSMRKIARAKRLLALAEPEPFTLANLTTKSLTAGFIRW